jgi:type II secretion system protein N
VLNFNLKKIKLSRKSIGYIAYFVGITAFFLYYLFPSDAVKGYVAYRLGRVNPDLDISIERISPIMPPGIKLHDVGIYRGNRALIDLESVKITPGLISFFSSKKTARFRGRVHAGNVEGWVEIENQNDQRTEKIEGTLSGIQLQAIPALEQLTPHRISGNLDGDFLIARSGPNGSVTGQLTLSECRIVFDQPVIGQPSLGFKNVAADLVLKNGRLVIKKCRARGNDLDADISGTIALNRTGRRKELNLNGSMTPHHAFLAKIENRIPTDFLEQKNAGGQAISFRVGGTMENPEFSLN